MKHVHKIQQHRGPDASADIVKEYGPWKVQLAHQRLAIIDLISASNQPMYDHETGSTIIFNGEIYNYLELRKQLESLGVKFFTVSDTEVLLRACLEWGVKTTLARCNGMFSFAFINQKERRLYLARDRFGEKPLYYVMKRDLLIFASEIKTILEILAVKTGINKKAVASYLVLGLHDFSNETFFQDVLQFPPASVFEIDLSVENLVMRQAKYWEPSPSDEVQKGIYTNFLDAVEALRCSFIEAVRIRLRSDVPVGILLSGGVDSSSIAAAAKHSGADISKIMLLSATSTVPKFNEEKYIDIVSEHLGWPATKVVLEPNESLLLAELERLTWINDEPLGSLSNISHMLLMRAAREHGITVLLTGQGADELLLGYKKYVPFYLKHLAINRRYGRFAAETFSFLKNGFFTREFRIAEARRYLPKQLRGKLFDTRGSAIKDFILPDLNMNRDGNIVARQHQDLFEFSVPKLLHYEDRQSMAESREMRAPFLDHSLVELLMSFPPSYKLKEGWSKYIFRKSMEPLLPKPIVWRKDKKGFINPQAQWLRFELRDFVMKYFIPESLIFQTELVDFNSLAKKYQLFVENGESTGILSYEIFAPLALEIWLRKFRDNLNL
jgi:asparagine synthase (glutamine-hydrolysing)